MVVVVQEALTEEVVEEEVGTVVEAGEVVTVEVVEEVETVVGQTYSEFLR